jgi:hypothetical protein
MIIGVSGVAGAGKDLFVETCAKELSKIGKTSTKLAIAAKLKHEVRDWCLQHYGIDSVDCSREDKEKIRNFLVAHGTTKRHATQGRHWVEQLQEEVLDRKDDYDYLFISDLRYTDYPKDEVYWLQEEMGGKLVHIQQYTLESRLNSSFKTFRKPANGEEKRNEPNLQTLADYNLEWEFNENFINKDKYISSKVVKFIEWLSTQ